MPNVVQIILECVVLVCSSINLVLIIKSRQYDKKREKLISDMQDAVNSADTLENAREKISALLAD